MADEPSGGWNEALGSEATNPPEPRTTGETFTALGRSWTVSSLEHGIKAQFEKWVRGRAEKIVAEIERSGDPEAVSQTRSTYIADRAAGHYDWNGRYVRNARSDLPGIKYQLYLLLYRCHPEITEQQAEDIFMDNPRGASFALRWAQGNSSSPASNGKPGENMKASPAMTLQECEESLEKVRTAMKKNPLTLDSP